VTEKKTPVFYAYDRGRMTPEGPRITESGVVTRPFVRMRTVELVAQHKGVERAGSGLRYLGVTGADHVVRDREGRLYRVDLVLNKVSLCVGIAPRVERW
jgi:hypothetical protein